MGWLKDESGLEKTAANHVPLTPLSHLNRAAALFPDKTAIVDRDRRLTYAQYRARASQLAAALVAAGVEPGDVVATLLPNILAQAEAHWGVPATGAILNTINTRLDVDTIAYIFGHGAAKVVLVDTAFLEVAEAAVARMEGGGPRIIEVADDQAGLPATGRHTEYEGFIAGRDEAFRWHMPEDEWESLALNYTSGTTGRPKGVVYSHRGAYLHTLGLSLDWGLNRDTVYLTIVPLFHCNNWIHTWSIPAVGGTVVCCRDITAKAIYDAIADERVTNFGGAPIVLNMIVNAKDEDRRSFDHIVNAYTAGAPPPAATLAAIEPLGFSVTQMYGLTETYGHTVECIWKDDWADLPEDERFARKARTGVAQVMMEHVTVLDEDSMAQVPMDGATVGEVMFRGNVVMKGYLKNPDGHRGGLPGRLFPLRRRRVPAPRRLHQDHRPVEGHHHFRRRERVLGRGRGRADAPSSRAALRGRGQTGPDMGRGALRLRRAQGGGRGHGRGTHRLRARAVGRVQDAQADRLRGVAEDLHRQDPEIRTAQAGTGSVRDPGV